MESRCAMRRSLFGDALKACKSLRAEALVPPTGKALTQLADVPKTHLIQISFVSSCTCVCFP